MTNLLRIDSSARSKDSHSRQLADRFLKRWLEIHPKSQVVTRDLAKESPPHITQESIIGLLTLPDQATKHTHKITALSDRLIAELKSADLLLISVPMYNFSIPSTLKAWIDHVVRLRHTFDYSPTREFIGLLEGKRAVVAVSAGAVISTEPMATLDFVTPYLKALLSFLGFRSVAILRLEGSNSDQEAFTRSLAITDAQIEHLVRDGE
jgi:FMN-dependent NADH-azoreductase